MINGDYEFYLPDVAFVVQLHQKVTVVAIAATQEGEVVLGDTLKIRKLTYNPSISPVREQLFRWLLAVQIDSPDQG